MRAARVSMYGPDLNALTAVLHANEIAVPLEDAIRDARKVPGFVAVDVFETDEDVMGATLEAVNRHAERSEREHHQALMYHYNVSAMSRVTEGGVLTQTIPSPLSTAELIDVLEQIADHPEYRHQLMVAISEDEQIVTMRDGDAHVVRDRARNGDSH